MIASQSSPPITVLATSPTTNYPHRGAGYVTGPQTTLTKGLATSPTTNYPHRGLTMLPDH